MVAICQEDLSFPFRIISHAAADITYINTGTRSRHALARRVHTAGNQNKHWTTLLTVAPGNPICQYDTRHD